MKDRLEIHSSLLTVLSNVYFCPPENLDIKYPCIIYEIAYYDRRHADNRNYTTKPCYNLSVIDPNPESIYPDEIIKVFPLAGKEKPYVYDGLYHFPLRLNNY